MVLESLKKWKLMVVIKFFFLESEGNCGISVLLFSF